jgi:Calx-beta domain/Carboxypeptidase regulatory-like domain
MRTIRTFGLLAIILMIATSTILAATVTIPAANTNTASNRKPLGTFFGFERTAAIYTVAEHGMTAGSTVTDVCWYVNAVTTPADAPTTILMSTTTATTFTASTYASEIAGATTVFSGSITGASLVVGSFRCVTLTTPFAYTANNLKVMVQTDAGGGGSEGSGTAKQFRWSAGASQTWQADTTAPAGNGTVSTTSRPNAQLIFTPAAGPGTLQFSSATYGGNEGTSATITVNRVGGQDGAVSVNYATSDGTATAADYTTATGTLNWAALDSAPKTFTVPLTIDLVTDVAETVILTLSTPVGTTITGTNPATLTITDVPPPFSGPYTVGSGGNYPSLTNAGGIFEAINLAGASGAVTINVISDLTGELGTNALNPIAGNPNVLIKPSGAARTISGIAPIAVIRINGADNIRIDGSTAASVVGGNPALRELTVQNLSTLTSSGVIHIGSMSESSNGNSVKNVNAVGSLNAVGVLTDPATLSGITFGGPTSGSAALFVNNNSTIENCSVRTALFGIASLGITQATPNIGTIITQNDMTGTGTARIKRLGIFIHSDNGGQITQNSIGGIDNTGESADAVGIGAGLQGISDVTTTTTVGVQNMLIARNKINGISQDATFSAAGIIIAGVTGATNTIANNMVTGVTADGDFGDFPTGIFVTGVTGSITKVYYNSVSMTGDRSALLTPATDMNPSFALSISGSDPIVELKNNIFYTTQTATTGGADATSYAIGTNSAAFANLDSDYNDFFSTGAQDGGFRSGSLDRAVDAATEVDYATVALWSTAVADDVNSVTIGEVDPLFVNPLNDLHILMASTLKDKGIAVSVLDDFDGNIRSLVGLTGGIPDLGGDEFVAPSAAGANVRGRLISPYGRSLANASVSILNTSSGETLSTRSNQIGYFNFADLPVGNVYVIVVNSKRFIFNSYSFTLNEDLTDLVLTANSNDNKQ